MNKAYSRTVLKIKQTCLRFGFHVQKDLLLELTGKLSSCSVHNPLKAIGICPEYTFLIKDLCIGYQELTPSVECYSCTLSTAPEPTSPPVHSILHISHCRVHTAYLYCMFHPYYFTLHTVKQWLPLTLLP